MDEPYAWIRELDLRALGEKETAGHPREHGSSRGYDQHRYRHEKPCEACRLANNERERDRRMAS